MSNPPKQKGTGGETEVLRELTHLGIDGLVRTSPGMPWDVERDGTMPVEVLATRPDHGQWLITMTLADFQDLFTALDQDVQDEQNQKLGLRIEVKRYRRFSHHTIFESKYGRSKGV